MDYPFTPAYRLTSGPLKGYVVDEGEEWLTHYGVATYADAEEEMQVSFEEWCQSSHTPPDEDAWERWLESWEAEELSY
jgi:hypothetical protein